MLLEYSNANSVFLAECIERVIGKPFPMVVKDEILTPLGMNSTCVTKDDLDQIPQHRRGPYMRYFDNVCCPAMGFWSTAEDLAKLFKAMLAPKQSKLITWLKGNRQLDIDLFSPAIDFKGLTYSLFGTGFPPDADFGWESRNSLFSPAAERDRTNFYPNSIQCFTGAINGFDSSCQPKCTVERPQERMNGACQSMEEEVMVYIHHGAALLPVLLPALLPVPLF